ncbi:MAG TPA: HEAT repeat domain-containing protein, partial [Blastocatellia bacterium]
LVEVCPRLAVLVIAVFLSATVHSDGPGRAVTRGAEQTGAQSDERPLRTGFIEVQGPDLRARFEAAIDRGRSDQAGKPFWVAYSFPVRPGIRIDCCDRCEGVIEGTGLSSTTEPETRDVGIFFLCSPRSESIERAQVYNLQRRHDFEGHAVLWAGKADAQETIANLRGLIDSNQTDEVYGNCVTGLGILDGAGTEQTLKDLTVPRYRKSIRSSSVFWVGRFAESAAFLDAFARDAANGLELRKQAVFSMGSGVDESALGLLQRLYDSADPTELKKQVIFAVSINKQSDQALGFLINLARNEPELELRKQAIFWLGQKAGERSLQALGDIVDGSDEDIEVQKQAVFAISQRPKDEAIPILIRVAKTHHRAEVRKNAIFWLGQIGDQRAVDLFEEILEK